MRNRDSRLGLIRWLAVGCALSIVIALPAKAGSDEDPFRSVQGIVTDESGRPLSGAVVQLENRRTLLIRSYRTGANGRFDFYELDKDVDYGLSARFGTRWSEVHRLTRFDSRKAPIVDLRIDLASHSR